MPEKEFSNRKNAAVRQMWEMNSRSKFGEEEKSEKNSDKTSAKQKATSATSSKPSHSADSSSYFSPLQSLFSSNILNDSDTVIILCLIFILMKEETDKTLLFALVYILL